MKLNVEDIEYLFSVKTVDELYDRRCWLVKTLQTIRTGKGIKDSFGVNKNNFNLMIGGKEVSYKEIEHELFYDDSRDFGEDGYKKYILNKMSEEEMEYYIIGMAYITKGALD